MEKDNFKAAYAHAKSLVGSFVKDKQGERLIAFLKSNPESLEEHHTQKLLGDLYHFGIPGQLEPNIEDAIKHYTLAIEMGHALAAYELGNLYRYGVAGQLEPDIRKAMEYYRIAVEKGHAHAAFILGRFFEEGIPEVLEVDPKEAIKYCTLAFKMGEPEAVTYLGHIYAHGIRGRLEPNAEEAIKHYTLAFKMREAGAAHSLGSLYLEGIRGQLEPNPELALKWFLTYQQEKGAKYSSVTHCLDVPSHFSRLSLSNKNEMEESILTLRESMQQAQGILQLEVTFNDEESTASQYKDSLPIPALLTHYKALMAYQDTALDILKAFENPGFMVTIARVRHNHGTPAIPDTDQGTYLRSFTFKGRQYLTFGEENVIKATRLLKEEDEQYQAAQESLGLLEKTIHKVHKDCLAELIKIQQHKRILGKMENKEEVENLKLLESYNSNLLTVFKNARNLRGNLLALLEETTPLRNEEFIKHYKFVADQDEDA